MNLTAVQRDRAAGALLGMAAGDALGAPYEFGPPLGLEVEVAMAGGQGWEPGEWTDDSAMALVIAQAAVAHGDLRSEAALDEIVTRWRRWAQDAKDVGLQTRHVLEAAHRDGLSARTARAATAALHAETGRTAGNGSLMRTAPVALVYLDDEDALVEAARMISELTHYDPDTGDACVLWSLAIRHAILTGDLDVRVGLDRLPADRRDRWNHLLAVAEQSTPADFHDNGWVVEALQAAWSAIVSTSATPGDANDQHLPQAIEAAVRGGRDADTVAAIAGALVGAAYGAEAVPASWREPLHGWPSMSADGLAALAPMIIKTDAHNVEPFVATGLPNWAEQHRAQGHNPHPAPTEENPERWDCDCGAVWRTLTREQLARKYAHLGTAARARNNID